MHVCEVCARATSVKLAEGWVHVVKPVLDSLSVADAQINVVEVVAMHLSCPSCVSESFPPSAVLLPQTPRLLLVVQPTFIVHYILIILRLPCPTSSFAVLRSRQRRPVPPQLYCQHDFLGYMFVCLFVG